VDETSAERPGASKRWLAFVRNHREAIAAMDFFTVPTITLGVLYCFLSSLMVVTHSASQRHQASDEPVGRPTVAGSVSV